MMDQTFLSEEWLDKQEEWRDRDDTFYWRMSQEDDGEDFSD